MLTRKDELSFERNVHRDNDLRVSGMREFPSRGAMTEKAHRMMFRQSYELYKTNKSDDLVIRE